MSVVKKTSCFSSKTKSILFALAWGIFFSLTMSLVKLMSHHTAPLTLLVVRMFFGLLFFSPFILKTGTQSFKTPNFLLHFLRAVLVSIAMFCTYYTYSHLPLALATSIGFTGPLITVLFSSLVFKERISFWQWLALIGGYGGVLIMVQPQSLMLNEAVWVALLGNIVTSCIVLLTKKLSNTESTLKIMTYSSFLSFLLMGSIFIWTTSLPSQADLWVLALAGGLGILSQFCYIQALKYGQPSHVAPFEYVRLVLMLPLGYFLFDEAISLLTFCGSVIIIVTTYYLTVTQSTTMGFWKTLGSLFLKYSPITHNR